MFRRGDYNLKYASYLEVDVKDAMFDCKEVRIYLIFWIHYYMDVTFQKMELVWVYKEWVLPTKTASQCLFCENLYPELQFNAQNFIPVKPGEK